MKTIKTITLFLLLLLSGGLTFAQTGGGCYAGQVIAPPQPFGLGQPAPGAIVRVCSPNATGTICSPLALGGVFSDPGLLNPISNPFTADQNGNYNFCAASGNYLVQTFPQPGATYSFQATVGVIPNGSYAFSGNNIFTGTNQFSGIELSNTLCTGALAGFSVLCATSAGPEVSINGAGFLFMPTIAGDIGGTPSSPTVTSAHITGGTVNTIPKFNSTGNPVPSACTDNGSTVACSGNVTVAGTLKQARNFGRCYVDGVTYATYAAAYADTTNCLDIYLPPNYTETQVGGQFHFTRTNVNTHCMGGSCSFTNTAGWKIDPNANFHSAFLCDAPWAVSAAGTPQYCFSFLGYTGSGVAFSVGDSTGNTGYVSMKNVYVSLASAGANAIGIKFFRTIFGELDKFSCQPTADSQTCIDSDGTGGGGGDFTGFIHIKDMQIGAGPGGTNATCVRSGPDTSAFHVDGGNCTLINAGTSRCFVADGGELFFDGAPNCNTAATAEVTLKNGAFLGRISGRVRHDSGVGVPFNFGLGAIGSDIFCVNCSISGTPGVENNASNGFNSFKTPDSWALNGFKWSVNGGTGNNNNFSIKDVVNNRLPFDSTPLGNTLLGNGAVGRPGAGGAQMNVQAGGGVEIGNTADAAVDIITTSGTTAAQQTSFHFRDRGSDIFQLVKATDNSFRLINSAGLNQLFLASGETDLNAQAGASAVNINVASNSGTGGIAFWSGGASSTKKSLIDTNGNFHPNVAAGVGLGLGTLPFSNLIIGSGNSAVSTITSASTTNKSVVFPDIAGNVIMDAGAQTFTGAKLFTTIGSATNCSSSASPAVCGSASAGSFVIAAGSTTVTVNTTAVTANSQIFLQPDDSLGTKLSVTCNTTGTLLDAQAWVSARTAATSFAVTINAAPSVNPECFSYVIFN